MDALNRFAASLSDHYRSMTPGARVLAASLLVVIVVSLGYLSTHQTTAADSELLHGLPVSVSQLPLMEAAFAKANLKGYEIRGTSIFVPRGQEAVYMAALVDAKALPTNPGDASVQAMDNMGLFIGVREREERLKIAKQQDLAHCICRMNGIESATVLYDIDTKSSFDQQKLITATASVKPVGASQLDESRVIAIRHLIAGAIAGLRPENVTVSDLNGSTWYGKLSDAATGEKAYIALQRAYEQDLKAKILNALGFIPNVTVEPSVTFDRQPATGARSVHHEKPQGAHRTVVAAKTPPARANVDSVINALLGEPPARTAQTTTDDAVTGENERAEPSNPVLVPVLARVSVGVPMSYFRHIWQQQRIDLRQNNPATVDQAAIDRIRVEESTKIQRHVVQLLPPTERVSDPAQLVTVTTFQDFAPAMASQSDVRELAQQWIVEHWRAVGLSVVVLLGVIVLWLFVRPRSRPVANQVADAPRETLRVDAEETVRKVQPAGPHFTPAERVLRDELSDLVQNDPDAAATILRTWIGQAD